MGKIGNIFCQGSQDITAYAWTVGRREQRQWHFSQCIFLTYDKNNENKLLKVHYFGNITMNMFSDLCCLEYLFILELHYSLILGGKVAILFITISSLS